MHDHPSRPICALFTHSLERNGANNFCLYVARQLLASQTFVVFSPKSGPMKQDFEDLGLRVGFIFMKWGFEDLGFLRVRMVGGWEEDISYMGISDLLYILSSR